MKTSFAIVTLSAALAACGVAPQQQPGTTAAKPALSPEAQAASDAVFVLAQAELDAREGRWQKAVDALSAAARAARDPRLAKRATEIAAEAGSMPDAAACARLWFELEPSVEAADAYARASLGARDYASAATAFSQIVGRANDSTRGTALRYVLGVMASRQGDDQERAGVVEQVAQPYPDLAEAQVLLAEASRWRGDAAAAREHAQRAVALDPRAVSPVLALAQASEGGQGLAVLERFLKEHPEEVEVRHAYALMLASRGRAHDAARELARVAKVVPDNEAVLYLLGLIEVRTGDAKTGQARLERVAGMGGAKRNAALIALATIEQDRGDTAAAARWLDQATPGAEDDLELQFMRASVTAAQGDLEGGRRLLAAIPATDEATRVKVIVTEAGMLSQARKDAEGYAKLKEGVQQYPENRELLFVYALAAEQAGDMDEAQRILRMLIQRDGADRQALNALGYMLADHNTNLREARKLITQALRMEPESEAIIDSMGWLEYRSGNLKAAETLLRKAWSKRTDGDIGSHLAEVLWKRGKKAEARKLLKEVKRIQPDSKTFRDTAARLGVKP